MNINISLKCDACGEVTNCRIGMSNRGEQPLRFCCQHCGSPIEIMLGGRKSDISGAVQIHGNEPFDDKTNFVDLHLDFPVYFGTYKMGDTPFMRAAQRIGMEAISIHGRRLEFLDDNYAEFGNFETLLKFYARGKWGPFKNAIERRFGEKAASDKMQDLNAALYAAIARTMWPFSNPFQGSVDINQYIQIQMDLAQYSKVAFEAFIDEILDTGFLKNLQIACLEIYPRILKAELPLRPVLFLDFDDEYQNQAIPMRVSADQFDTYKDLYKDILETISRQFVLVAGLNNLLKRGSHDAFKPGIGLKKKGRDNTPKNLHAFANVSFGQKQVFIDDSWFTFDDEATDNQLRNAIAHFQTDYDEITQKITYFPRNEGIKQVKSEEMYFLEFMRRILIAYRELNRLHQLIKSLFYYHYLIQNSAQK